MRRRTPSEIKAYGDGYTEAYKEFCHLLTNYDVDKAMRKMKIFADAVVLTVETAKDEPQYEMGMGTLKCDNCSEYGSFKCTKCDGEMYFKRLEPKDEPQTEETQDGFYDEYYRDHEEFYEPQTEGSE